MKTDTLAPPAAHASSANWRQRLGACAGATLVALSTLLASPAAQADLVVQFSYVGYRGSDVNFNVTGTGQVTVDDSAGPSFGLADVLDFSFMVTGKVAGFPLQVQWGLGDLESFSLLLDSGGAVSDLALRTALVQPTHQQIFPQGFEVIGTTTGGTRYFAGGLTGGRVTIDSVTQVAAAVPEPASLALAAAGLLAAAGVRRRRPAA